MKSIYLFGTLPLLPVLAALPFIWLALRTRRRRRQVESDPRISVEALTDETGVDDQGAVRSVQRGEVWVPVDRLDELWTPLNLERLARTYWFHLGRISFRTIRVMYTPHGRAMALFGLIPLITFHEPDYDLGGGGRASVRWRINRGLLVSRRGADDTGYLEIDVHRDGRTRGDLACVHVQLAIVNFYPSMAERISRGFYSATQSRIHVYATLSFLRSLARGELVPSKVGRFAQWPREFDERRAAMRNRQR